jgi:hypothetical protein
MYHDTIAAILSPLKTAMTRPVVRWCPDGHFRRVIYDLAAYIADYPEQGGNRSKLVSEVRTVHSP